MVIDQVLHSYELGVSQIYALFESYELLSDISALRFTLVGLRLASDQHIYTLRLSE